MSNSRHPRPSMTTNIDFTMLLSTVRLCVKTMKNKKYNYTEYPGRTNITKHYVVLNY